MRSKINLFFNTMLLALLLACIDRMGFHYGLASIQACLYAHDRKQEYLRWKKHQRKRELRELALAV